MTVFLNIMVFIFLVNMFMLARTIVAGKINIQFSDWALKKIHEGETAEEIGYPNKIYEKYSVGRFILLHINIWTFEDELSWCKKQYDKEQSIG